MQVRTIAVLVIWVSLALPVAIAGGVASKNREPTETLPRGENWLSAQASQVPPSEKAPTWWRVLEVAPVSGAPDFGARWLVVVFLSPECPLANADVPVLNDLQREFGPKGVQLIGAYADPFLEPKALRQHARDYALSFPTVDDRAQQLMRRAGARYTPEVAVFASSGQLLYRGQIDDRVTGFQDVRPAATHQTLRDVMVALCAGRQRPFAETPGFGCSLPEARADQ